MICACYRHTNKVVVIHSYQLYGVRLEGFHSWQRVFFLYLYPFVPDGAEKDCIEIPCLLCGDRGYTAALYLPPPGHRNYFVDLHIVYPGDDTRGTLCLNLYRYNESQRIDCGYVLAKNTSEHYHYIRYLAMSSKIETRLHLAKGTLYTAAIQALLVESGITDFFVEANTATLQADREDWEPGTDRLTIINALAAEINYNSIWMDGGGTVHCSAFRMPSADAISVTYRDGEYSVQYPEWTQAVDLFDHPNVFIAEVDNPDLETSMRAVSVNDRPDSVFSTVNLGRRVVSYEKLDNIASQAELQAHADNKRFKSLQSTETRTFYTGPSGRHAVFDLVELVRDGESTLYEETGWRLELEQPYKMTHTGKRVVYLSLMMSR